MAAQPNSAVTPDMLAEYDTAMAEVLLTRNQAPPNLDYLRMSEASLHARSYVYSENMVSAIGVRSNRVIKGSANLGSHADGGAPWASLPKPLQPPIVSVVGADYIKRDNVVEFEENESNTGAQHLLNVIRRDKALKVQMAERNRALQESISRERDELEKAHVARELERQSRLGALKTTVKVYNHRGLERRAISAPLPGDSSEDEDYVQRRRHAVARSDEEAPVAGTMGLRIPGGPVAIPDAAATADAIVRGEAPSEVTIRPSTFWYPKDRQRFKHRMLEEQRLAAFQESLLGNGWAQTTDLGGAPKRVARANVLAGLPDEEKARIEAQAQEFLQAKMKRDEEARVKYNTMIARPRPSEMRGTVPVTTSPFPHEEVAPFREQVNLAATSAVNVAAGAAENPGARGGRVFVRPFMFDRPPPFKPLPVYRPELPLGPIPEELVKLEMPPLLDSHGNPLQLRKSAAPPWGRQADEDERFERIRINKATKEVTIKPLTKSDVTKEIRLVRDKGLFKRPHKSVAAQLSPAQQEFVRSIPSTGPLVAVAMRPATKLAAGALS